MLRHRIADLKTCFRSQNFYRYRYRYSKIQTACVSSSQPQQSALTPDKLQDIVLDTVASSSAFIPGRTDDEKKRWCVRKTTQILETFDNYIPVVGMFLDNPIVDDIEKQGIKLLVDWAWEKVHGSKPLE